MPFAESAAGAAPVAASPSSAAPGNSAPASAPARSSTAPQEREDWIGSDATQATASPSRTPQSTADTSAPAEQRPSEDGERNEVEREAAPVAEGPQDDASKLLDYYAKLAAPASTEATATTEAESSDAPKSESAPAEEAVPAQAAAFQKLAAIPAEQIAEALGLSVEDARQIVNLNSLAGRQGAELGKLRNAQKQLEATRQQAAQFVQVNDQGEVTGVNALSILEAATAALGPEGVQADLAKNNLVLLNKAEYDQLRQAPQASQSGLDQTEAGVINEVAQAFGIEGDDITLEEKIGLIEANPVAKLRLQRRLASLEAQASEQKAQAQAKTQAQQAAELNELQAMVADLEKSIPHLKELAPVMEAHHKANPVEKLTKSGRARELAMIAEAKTLHLRLPKLIDAAKKQGFADALKKLGIPASEVLSDSPPSGKPSSVHARNPVPAGLEWIGADNS